MSGARAGIFVDAFLHQEGGVLVDEVGQRLRIADRRTGAEKFEKSQRSLQNRPAMSVVSRTTRRHSSIFKG